MKKSINWAVIRALRFLLIPTAAFWSLTAGGVLAESSFKNPVSSDTLEPHFSELELAIRKGPEAEVFARANQPLLVNDQEIIRCLKNFQLTILTENEGICTGPYGNNVAFLGKGSWVELHLELAEAPAVQIRPERLIARLDFLEFPFRTRSGDRGYSTGRIQVSSLESWLYIKPTGVSIFYKDVNSESYLGKQGILAVDTTPPPKAKKIRIEKRGNSFFLAWAVPNGDINEFCLYRWHSGRWRPISSGLKEPEASIQKITHGRFKIVVYDCALNRSETEASFPRPVPPPRPTSVRPIERTANGFSLTWNSVRMDKDIIYTIQKWDSGTGKWENTSHKMTAPPARIEGIPAGRFRVKAVNWAGTGVCSDVVELEIPSMLLLSSDNVSIERQLMARLTAGNLPVNFVTSDPDYAIEIESNIEFVDRMYGLER